MNTVTPQSAALEIIRSLSPEQIAYASSPDRGEYRGLAALHDLMDANMLLPGAENFDASDEVATAFYNRVMDEVSTILKSGVLK